MGRVNYTTPLPRVANARVLRSRAIAGLALLILGFWFVAQEENRFGAALAVAAYLVVSYFFVPQPDTNNARFAADLYSALTPGTSRAYSERATNLEQERATMSNIFLAALAAALLTSVTASAHSTAATPPAPAAANATTLGGTPDLQGLWDFTMRVGERTSPGFFALGPVEQGWAGSLTLYLTNTLAIRVLTVDGDSVRMVVASREGDVRFNGRLTDNGRTMEGIVDYHGGARLPMRATRRTLPVAPR